MEINDLVNLITNSGMSIVIIGYFLYRDWKYNEQLITLMSELKQTLDIFQSEIHRKRGASDED